MEKDWYVYSHTRLDKNEIFYIGIGKLKNYARAFYKYRGKRNEIWFKITKKTNWTVNILYDKLNKDEASLKEQELIKLYGRKDLGTGTLCNMTDGGDGIWNCIRTTEFRKKMSDGKLGNKNPMYGKTVSKETIEKKRISSIGQTRSDKTKNQQSLSSITSGQAKTVDVYKYITNEYIGRFYAISEACRQLGFFKLNGKACMVAKGKRNQVKGYVFKYVVTH